MPALPPYPLLCPRSASAALKHPKTKVIMIISSIVAFIFFVLFVLLLWLWFQIKGFQLYRNLRAAKATRKQAITNEKAWYASTRPVVRQPHTPRLLDVYTQEPHIQKEDRVAADDVVNDRAADVLAVSESEWFGSSRFNTTASGATRIATQLLEPLPVLDPVHQPSMEFIVNIGPQALSVRDSHETTGTIGTLQSIGVAVSIVLTKSSSASEVHHSSSSREDESDRGSVGVALPVTLSPPLFPKQVWITSQGHEEMGHDDTFVGDGDEE
jgi:hypothetical protein